MKDLTIDGSRRFEFQRVLRRIGGSRVSRSSDAVTTILKAAQFAARMHKDQRRKQLQTAVARAEAPGIITKEPWWRTLKECPMITRLYPVNLLGTCCVCGLYVALTRFCCI